MERKGKSNVTTVNKHFPFLDSKVILYTIKNIQQRLMVKKQKYSIKKNLAIPFILNTLSPISTRMNKVYDLLLTGTVF